MKSQLGTGMRMITVMKTQILTMTGGDSAFYDLISNLSNNKMEGVQRPKIKDIHHTNAQFTYTFMCIMC